MVQLQTLISCVSTLCMLIGTVCDRVSSLITGLSTSVIVPAAGRAPARKFSGGLAGCHKEGIEASLL